VPIFYDRNRLLFDHLVLVPLSGSVGESSNTGKCGKRAQLLHPRLAAVARFGTAAASATIRRNRPGSVTVVKSIESHCTHSTERAVAKGISDVASGSFTLSLAVMSDNLSCSNSGKSACSNITLGAGLASAPGILLLVDIDVVVAVVVLISPPVVVFTLVGVSLIVATAAIDLLHSALVVVIFFVALWTGDLSVLFSTFNKLVGWLLDALADDDGLRGFLPDNNRLHLHLHGWHLLGLGGLIADVDGLGLGWWGLGQRLGAEILSRPRVLLQLIGLLPREDLALAVVVPGNADLGARR